MDDDIDPTFALKKQISSRTRALALQSEDFLTLLTVLMEVPTESRLDLDRFVALRAQRRAEATALLDASRGADLDTLLEVFRKRQETVH
jgi:hypothetical protein